ncbi:hypothetical protein TSTA_101060 [Talaromyces stipitatus ATCC 10500]|uniref:Uncharacterized protein n=1 Tax=Talaromyces stipitatus (strain ATCC 10500 / CBS 375.48 / QM 6759 / NRRL 1006) TaxID=441959 RepID=B8MMU9_TALSN|nr:uncharacterized protein TSTA_101060 [Talaromyces stipitatus ATCC 10500]EED13866.1 hypothetical protein TSTA_101060 [Talaromyces stipitatus ATCC 10500]
MGSRYPIYDELTKYQALRYCRDIEQFVARYGDRTDTPGIPPSIDQQDFLREYQDQPLENDLRESLAANEAPQEESEEEPEERTGERTDSNFGPEFGPEEEPRTAARVDVLALIEGLRRSGKPYISHFCKIPQGASIPNFHGTDIQTGKMLMMYDLIIQQLKLGSCNDVVAISKTDCENLWTGQHRAGHWGAAKDVLEKLLPQSDQERI